MSMKDLLNKMTELQGSDTSTGKQVLTENTGVTDYNPKSQGGTRKELLAKYANSKDPKDAESARKAGATQTELKKAKDEVVESTKPSLKNIFNTMLNEAEQVDEKYMGFEKVKAAAKKGGAEDPGAVAASIGRKKYGKEKFQKAAAAGKKLGEAEQITIQPAKQNTQVIKQGQKTLGTVENPQLAAQIKQSIGKGEMTLAGDELQEDDVAEGYILKKTTVSKREEPGDHDEFHPDINIKDTDYEIINNKTGQIVGTASWSTNDYFGPGALKITMRNGATRWLDIWEREKGNPQTAFNRFLKDPKTAKKYKEQGVSESKLNEKAVSKSQQQAAGAALAAKRGDAPKSKLKGASKEMAKMSTKELEKFAGTKHKGLPEKKKTNESISSSVSDWFYVQGAKKIVNLLDSGENVMKLATMISTMDPKKQNDLVRGIEVYLSKYPHDKLQKLSDVLRVTTNEAAMPTHDGDFGAGLGAGRSNTTLEERSSRRLIDSDEKGNRAYKIYVDRDWQEYVVKFYENGKYLPDADYHADEEQEAMDTGYHFLNNLTEGKKAKPDYIDLDKDGNKKESMKKAAADKQKGSTMKKTNESRTILEAPNKARINAAIKYLQKVIKQQSAYDEYDDDDDFVGETEEIVSILSNAIKSLSTGTVDAEFITSIGRQLYDATMGGAGYGDTDFSEEVEEKLMNILGLDSEDIPSDNDRELMRKEAEAKWKAAFGPGSAADAKWKAAFGGGKKKTNEAKSKPDYIDLDKDGNKKESMKKAAADAKKKKVAVKEGANPSEAARLLGKAHALAKDPFSCKYESGTPEAQSYLAGYKEGLDECYGSGSSDMGQEQMPAVIPGMDAMGMAPADNDFEEDVLVGKTTYGGDTDNFGFDDYEDEETMMAFESWDRQLNALLNEGKMKEIDLDMKELSDAQFKKDHGMTKSQMKKSLSSDDTKDKKLVKEGVTVAINKDIENAPDSVTVTAQGDEADQLLALIKQAGMGLFGGDDQQATGSYGAPVAADTNTPSLGDVGDHDSMMALIQKMTAGAQDYADEESQDDEHVHGHPDAACDTCGSAECECDSAGTAMVVGEEETEDQMEFQVAEEADSEEAETTADEDAEAEEDKALAGADSKDEEEIDEEKELTEWANDANNQRTEDDSYYEDIEFMTKVISGGLNNQKQDQTTLPHTKVTVDDLTDWKKLSGIK